MNDERTHGLDGFTLFFFGVSNFPRVLNSWKVVRQSKYLGEG